MTAAAGELEPEDVLLGALLEGQPILAAITGRITPEDLVRPRNARILRALLASPGIPPLSAIPPDLLRHASALMTGLPGLPAPHVAYYVAEILERARKRRLRAAAIALSKAASNGAAEDEVRAALADAAEAASPAVEPGPLYAPLSGLADPDVGKTAWLVDNLLPADELTLLAAAWKTAKTLLSYRLALDAVFGAPVWGRFAVPRPLRVAVFQLEMPHREDLRRLRRLATGAGYAISDVVAAAADGRLALYSRPDIDLARAPAAFLRLARATCPDLVIVDSAVAAFAGDGEGDINDPTRVRALLARSFGPLTTAGISVLVLHHFRKPSQVMGKDDPRGQVLGSIQFGAAAGRVYGLERLKDERDAAPGSFKLLLSLIGSWAPGELEAVVVGVEDTPDDTGTIVAALPGDPARDRTKILPAFQQAALNIKGRAERAPGIPRKEAISLAVADLGISQRSAEEGLIHAEGMRWVHLPPGGARNAKRIFPGSAPATDDPEAP